MGATFRGSSCFADLSDGLERIHSRRLALRPVCLSDTWPLHESTKNPLFNAHLAWDAPPSFNALLQRIQAIISAARQGRLSAVSAVTKATGAWVSLYRFLPWKDDPEAIEVGVWTHPDYWHGRYSLELVLMCFDAAFTLTKASRLIGLSVPANRSSCRLMELTGMQPAGTTVRYAESGRRLDVVQYEIHRAAWERRAAEGLKYEMLDIDGPIAEELEKGYRIQDEEVEAHEAIPQLPALATRPGAFTDHEPAEALLSETR